MRCSRVVSMACLVGACTPPPPAPPPALPGETSIAAGPEGSGGPAASAARERGAVSAARPESTGAPPASPVWERGSATEVSDGPPILVVSNHFPLDQFVWLDDTLLGMVAAGSERAFDVPTGAHVVTCSDSATRATRASFVAEVFDTGYRYRYEVVAR